MLNNNQNFVPIGEDIFVKHGFVTDDEIYVILNKIKLTKQEEWDCSHPEGHGVLSPMIKEVGRFTERLQNMIPDPLFVHKIGGVNRLTVGQKHGIHSDNHDFLPIRELHKNFESDKPYKLVDDTVYGVVIYLNDDYDGGEIFYTKQNITYKPIAGDIIIHSAEEHCEHGVNPVKIGSRYSISSSIRKKIKVNINNV